MSSFQTFKIFIVNKKNLNKVVIFVLFFFFVKYFMYSQFTSYILSLLYFGIRHFIFAEKQVETSTTTALYLFKV